MTIVEVYECKPPALTISAIKYVRVLRNLGLAEAKHLIDEVCFYERPIRLDFPSGPEAAKFASHMDALGFSCRFVVANETLD